jgi:hypothetical protein
MAKIATMSFVGKSGRTYAFDFYPIDTAFEALRAVYVITRRVSSPEGVGGGHGYIYVGETENLSTVFDAHHKQACFYRHSANCIGIHVDGSQQSRRSKEDDVLQGNHWPCND